MAAFKVTAKSGAAGTGADPPGLRACSCSSRLVGILAKPSNGFSPPDRAISEESQFSG